MTAQAQTLPRLDPHLVYLMDAVVSFVMGIALLVAAQQLTTLAAWTMPSSFLSTLGLLLFPWAAFNAWIGRTARPAATVVTANIIGDALWIAGTVALIAIHAQELSGPGVAMLVGQGIAVSGVLATKLVGRSALAA